MKNKFTAGTWQAKEGQIYPTETGKTLALIPYFDKDNDEHEANAKLIAAAPELLEMCIATLEDLESGELTGNATESALINLRQAIQKATDQNP
jgi:hypothetical protein